MTGNLYRGNAPMSAGWEYAGEFEGWVAFFKKCSNGWTQIKVASWGKARNKANYWMAWGEGRFSGGKDIEAMRGHRPDLMAWVEGLVKDLPAITGQSSRSALPAHASASKSQSEISC